MWTAIKKFFKDSETIFLARMNVLVGLVITSFSLVDPALVQPLLTPRGFAIYLLINGVVMEYARKRRADDM